MKDINSEAHYLNAKKMGSKEYSKYTSKGENGYLPYLESILKDTEIISEVDIGIVEIPLKKIVGTYSYLRSRSFAKNFMPILNDSTEFNAKWRSLCYAHLVEGIKHSIKVYEYLNWFYVIEGNKRVSVLKYFDAYSIFANILRLIPKKDENNPDICIYYEFLKFNKITNLYSIYFSKAENFEKLLKKLKKYNPIISLVKDKYKHFELYVYNPFRNIYKNLGGDKLSLTTGDAFLEYAKVYGIPQEIDAVSDESKIKEILCELEHNNKFPKLYIQTDPLKTQASPSVISALTSLVMPKKKKLKVAFAYDKTIGESGWTYGHELGRQYVSRILKNQVETSFVENVPENNEEAYNILNSLVAEGNNIIFTTSPMFKKATLKCAMDNTNVKFFNCAEYQPYIHVGNYFGRTYETRFLTGLIAGVMTKSNIIGYVATSPAPEVISSINAFALGAKIVNPYAKVKVSWTNNWNNPTRNADAAQRLVDKGVDIISNQILLEPHPITHQYGAYSMLCTIDKATGLPDKYLAAPIWNWGIFYEKILKSILNDNLKTLSDIYGNDYKMINFWWGIASGVLDIYVCEELVPETTKKLVRSMRKMIIDNDFHPFSGPIYDTQGALIIDTDEIASHEQILTMNWFVEDVDAESPFKNS